MAWRRKGSAEAWAACAAAHFVSSQLGILLTAAPRGLHRAKHAPGGKKEPRRGGRPGDRG